ncbi:MAG: penicillin-binding protein 2 [Acidobacteria bacterium]|nr:penicillin-binding protein 2 [Acidobacteriota bacterium]
MPVTSNLVDRRDLALRLWLMQAITVVVFSSLAISFWYFQIVQHARFQEMAENNHQRTLALRAPRGVLFDRYGKVLVENRYAFNISLVREQTKDIPRTVQFLAGISGADEETLREIVDRHRDEPAYRPIVLIEDATLAQVAAVRAHKLELPEIDIEEVPTRHYPSESFAAHLFGYVGEVTDAQLARADYRGIHPGTIVGQSGIEHVYNKRLMGRDGARQVVVNSTGREIVTIGEIQPTEGHRLQLTLDSDLQRAAEEGFKATGFAGAAVILDPRNGEVLTFLSLPAYDPNAFTGGIDRVTWGQLNTDKLRPLQNRAIQGRYSPGSTFKVVVATAALQEGVITPSFRVHCSGGAFFYGRYFQCHLKRGHGSLDLRHAIEQSCNVYFYTVGNMVGIDRLHRWATALGLGVKSGIDLPNEVEGLMPSSAWKKAKKGEKWYAGETISVSIGQGQVSVTPIQLAMTIATVANGGTRFTPHLLKAYDDGGGWKPVPAPPPQSIFRFKAGALEALRDGLWLVVNGFGTGGRGRIEGRDVCAKTGTAQVISLQGGKEAAGRTDKDLRDHGWFVFFAPRDNPQIAGVVFAEHAEHGYLAAPIAKHVMMTYFAKKEGKPLPEFPTPPRPAQVVAAAGAVQ